MRLELFSISGVQRDVIFFAHPVASKIRAKFANESMANSLWPQPSWVDNESAT